MSGVRYNYQGCLGLRRCENGAICEIHRREMQRMQETKVIAHLPRLDVEIIRQHAADPEGACLSIRLQAYPSFKAWDDFVLQNTAPQALTWWTSPFLQRPIP
jgi:hypothetical protein